MRVRHLLPVCGFFAVQAFAQATSGVPQAALALPAGPGVQSRQGPAVHVRDEAPGVRTSGQPQPMPSPVVQFDLTQESLDRVSPYSPDEVRRLRSELDERERAWYENLGKKPQPRAVVSEYRLDLSPGASPPVVRVTLGQGALVTFLSADAKPWPIKNSENFNSKGIHVTQLAAHVLSVSLLSPYATGSVGVMLDGLASGITFTVVPAQKETDHRVEMVVPKVFGAGTETDKDGVESFSPMPGFNTQELSQYLYKIPPATAKALKVEGAADVTAWQVGKDRMIVRTALTVVSPASFRRHSSADGTHVYELPLTSVITVQGPRATYQPLVISGIQIYGRTAATASAKEAAQQ